MCLCALLAHGRRRISIGVTWNRVRDRSSTVVTLLRPIGFLGTALLGSGLQGRDASAGSLSDALASSGLSEGAFTGASLFWGLVLGSVGLGLFIYGKKNRRPYPLIGGVVLSVLPYAVTDSWILGISATGICALLWMLRGR
jgi:hypothetical protein